MKTQFKAVAVYMPNEKRRIKGPVNIMLFDAVGTELIFPDLEPGQHPQEGDEIKIEGVSNRKMNGEFTMPDGTVLTAKEGVVTNVWLPKEVEERAAAFLNKVYNVDGEALSYELRRSKDVKGSLIRQNGKPFTGGFFDPKTKRHITTKNGRAVAQVYMTSKKLFKKLAAYGWYNQKQENDPARSI